MWPMWVLRGHTEKIHDENGRLRHQLLMVGDAKIDVRTEGAHLTSKMVTKFSVLTVFDVRCRKKNVRAPSFELQQQRKDSYGDGCSKDPGFSYLCALALLVRLTLENIGINHRFFCRYYTWFTFNQTRSTLGVLRHRTHVSEVFHSAPLLALEVEQVAIKM